MATPNPTPPRAAVPIRSPVFHSRPTPAPDTETFLPSDPFPPGFVDIDEKVVLAVKPTLLAFLSPPALLSAGVSLGALGAFGALAPTNAPIELLQSLFLLFAGSFVAAVIFWSRILGRGYLVVLLLAYFLATFVFVVATIGGNAPSGVVVGAQAGLFLGLEVVVPGILATWAWFQSFYAVTDRRAIEVSGYWNRSARDLPLAQIRSIASVPPLLWSHLGFGTVLLRPINPVGGLSWTRSHLSVRRQGTGLAFFGVRGPDPLARAIQSRVDAAARTPSTPPASVPPLPCPRCGGPTLWVAPAGRAYCAACGQFV